MSRGPCTTSFFEGLFDEFKRAPAKTSIKIVLLGDGGIGKTSYFDRISSGDSPDYKFSKVYDATRGCNVCQIEYLIGKHKVTLHLFDTAGQEKFGVLRDSYLMGADGVVIMYDLTEDTTRDSVLKKWLPDLKKVLEATARHNQSYIPVAVIGNKSDSVKLDNYDDDKKHAKDKKFITALGSFYDCLFFGPIEHFCVSVKADEGLIEPINYLLKHILSYYTPVNVKRTSKPSNVIMCN